MFFVFEQFSVLSLAELLEHGGNTQSYKNKFNIYYCLPLYDFKMNILVVHEVFYYGRNYHGSVAVLIWTLPIDSAPRVLTIRAFKKFQTRNQNTLNE